MGQRLMSIFWREEEEGDGKRLTLPLTKEGGNVASSSLGPP